MTYNEGVPSMFIDSHTANTQTGADQVCIGEDAWTVRALGIRLLLRTQVVANRYLKYSLFPPLNPKLAVYRGDDDVFIPRNGCFPLQCNGGASGRKDGQRMCTVSAIRGIAFRA